MKLSTTNFAWFIILTLGCTHHNPEYINHDKWKLSEGYDFGYIRAQPKEVKSTYYYNLNDSTLNAEGKVLSIYWEKFDKSGNIYSAKVEIENQEAINFDYRYSDSGIMYHSYSFNDHKHNLYWERWSECKPINSTSFMCSYFMKENNNSKRTFLYTDSITITDDQYIRKRKYQNRPALSSITWYKNEKIIKTETMNGNEVSIDLYFRNEKNVLDSIISSNGRTTIFYNNEYGDPVLSYEIYQGDTIINRRKYEYDLKRNWIRRLDYNSDHQFINSNERFPGFGLTVRTISY